MSWLERERCIEMEQVTKYEQEDVVGHASEAGLFGHSVNLVAVRRFSTCQYGSSVVIRGVEENLEVVSEAKSLDQEIENDYGRGRVSIATSVD